MVAGDVTVPGFSGFGQDAGGVFVVEAEHGGDDGCWGLEHEVAQG